MLEALRLSWSRRTKWPVLVLAAMILVALFPGEAWRALRFSAANLVIVSPMIVLGMLLTALVVASGGTALIERAFRGRQSGMILAASVIGAVTPVCGITVLPLVAGLLAAGVPLAPIMAFWLASPITDPGMLTVTAGTIGFDFALGKSLAALAIGLFGGFAILILQGLPGRARALIASPLRQGGKAMDVLCSTAQGCAAEDFTWAFWREPERRQAFAGSLRATGKLMLLWLSLAFLAEYFLRAYLPADVLSGFVGAEGFGAVPLAAAVGAPLYLDAYGALPLIRGLMEKGMAPGAAMAFLVSGGIVSAYAAIPVYALVRLPVFVLYLLLAVFGAMLAGWGYGFYAG